MVIEESRMDLLIVSGSLGLAILILAILAESERRKVDTKIAALVRVVDTSIKIADTSNDQMRNQIWLIEGKALTDYQTLLDMQKQLDTVTKQLNATSEALLEKEDKRTLTIDEALARIPKKSALKEKKPSRKTPTLARKLTKAK